jgi:DNA-binding transcriptional MerR regulator
MSQKQLNSNLTPHSSTVLPVRPRPIKDESTLGYLARVARVNGYESVAQLMLIFSTYSEFTSAMLITDAELSELLGPYPSIWQQNLVGNELVATDFNQTTLRWCPLCLDESPYIRGIWTLKFACVCTRHSIELCELCPQCGRTQPLGRSDFEHCCCHASLSASLKLKADPALVSLMALLEAAIFQWPITPSTMPYLSTSAWLKLLFYLGQFSSAELPTKPGKSVRLRNLGVATNLMQSTALLLENWPHNFHELLDAIYRKHKQISSMHRVFGSLYRVLYVHLKDGDFQFLRDAFEQFLRQHWQGVIGKRNKLLTTETLLSHPQLTLKQAAQKAGTELATVRHLLEAELITTHQAKLPSGRRTISIHRAHVDKIAHLTQNNLSLKEAAKWLALPKSRVRQLLDAGLIKPLISPKATHAASWQIPHKELNRFKFKPQPMSNGSAEISINKILQHWRLQDHEFIALVSGLMNKELLPIATQSEPIVIGKIQLNKDKFQAWLDKQRLTAMPTMSVDQAAKILGLKQQVAYDLVRKGLMESTHDQAKGYRISTNQIRQFQEKFVSLAELARLRKCLPRKLLLEMNAPPVCGPTVDGTRQYFFLRAAIGAA